MASPTDSGAAQLPPAASSPPPLHAVDADEEDDNVKQLKECATLYLSLQANTSFLPSFLPSFASNRLPLCSDLDDTHIIRCLLKQECLSETNRNWKSCQSCTCLVLFLLV
ncbi:hypothetical protein BHE74_00038224 [Ensete ventricosum]|nr:hypothetical protein GW17_00031731 [Ensete ventricosum]RWW55159.1 hypothetical protein BHE74_00038224 [Ensete ventricosum]RZS12539.1 hypothetical protein BHM03_00043989 [Ensete ventricosum]